MWQALALLASGTIVGSVHLEGPRPAMEELKTSSDPFCPRMRDQSVIGNLANVVVHVVGAAPSPPPPEHHLLEQIDCRYSPRVSSIVDGQKVDIVNRDPTLHNAHVYSGGQTHF
jgi:hypothetical protein